MAHSDDAFAPNWEGVRLTGDWLLAFVYGSRQELAPSIDLDNGVRARCQSTSGGA